MLEDSESGNNPLHAFAETPLDACKVGLRFRKLQKTCDEGARIGMEAEEESCDFLHVNEQGFSRAVRLLTVDMFCEMVRIREALHIFR